MSIKCKYTQFLYLYLLILLQIFFNKAISLESKVQILDHLATGQGSTPVGKYLGVH